jgi:hypothetical protein
MDHGFVVLKYRIFWRRVRGLVLVMLMDSRQREGVLIGQLGADCHCPVVFVVVIPKLLRSRNRQSFFLSEKLFIPTGCL